MLREARRTLGVLGGMFLQRSRLLRWVTGKMLEGLNKGVLSGRKRKGEMEWI